MTTRENVIMAYEHKKPPWVPNAFTDFNSVLQSTVNERYEGKESGKDEFGVTYQYSEEAGAPIVLPGTEILNDIKTWEKEVKFPDVENYDWEEGAARDTADWDRENKFSVVRLYNGLFERMHALMGFENALMAVLLEPTACDEFFHASTEYRINLIKKIAEYYKPDSIMLFDDYGTERAMMISPDTWRELIKPHLNRIIETTHDCGLYYTLHSCGYIKPIFEDFIEIRADAVHPLQIRNDVKELKENFGNAVTFTGGYNTFDILDNQDAEEQEIRDETRRVLEELAPGGSYIAWQTILNERCRKIFIDEVEVYNKTVLNKPDYAS